jgi:thiamine biosynthesis protein ThiS
MGKETYTYKINGEMTLTINGEKTEIPGDMTVAGLLDHLKIEPGRVAVEVNMKIVKRDTFQNHSLHDGDTVEIVNFVGGG